MPPTPWNSRLRIVLVEPRNPLNIGAAARAMLNFGFSDLRLVRPREKAFREVKSAMGAAEVLRRAVVVSDLAEALGDASMIAATSALSGRATDMVQREAPAAAAALRTHLEARSAALVFGSEKFGLSRDDLSQCDWILTIPTNPGCPSMNLGQAVAVCCYELARRAQPASEPKIPASVGADERERIFRLLLPLLEDAGFVFPDSLESQSRKIRRWVSRLRLAPADARLFQGMLRQIRWRLDNPPDPE